MYKEKVLVTGADGFIGSHLVEALVREGFPVRAFVMYNSFGNWGWLDHAPDDIKGELNIFSGDIRDPFAVKAAMSGCGAVLHLAALIGIPYSYLAPQSYIDTNIAGTLHVVQAARDLGLTKVIQTSTSEVYGTARYVPIDEAHPLQGQSPYSASKIGADHIAMSYFLSFGTPVTILRPFNTYGPRQSARAVIPTVITQIAAGRRQLKLGSLTPTRDFNFVGDTVDGFLAALRAEGTAGEVINLGSNFEISIGELVRLIGEAMGVEVTVVQDDQRVRPANSEVERLSADNAKARNLLGWEPRYGGKEGLRRGLTATADWFTDAANLKRYKIDRYNV